MYSEHPVREVEPPRSESELSDDNNQSLTPEMRKAEHLEKLARERFKRWLQSKELNIASSLVYIGIALVTIVYLVEAFWFKKDSFASSFFDLMKTIIIAALGYLFGQHRSKGQD